MPALNRPTSVLVIAVLQLVFGGFGVLCYGCTGVMQATGWSMPGGPPGSPQAQMQQKMQADIQAAMESRLQNYKAVTMGVLLLEMLLCFVMIAGGIGLLNMQASGRTLTIAYGFFSLFMKIVNVAIGLFVTVPAMKAVMAGITGTMSAKDAAVFSQMSQFYDMSATAGAFMPICFAIYPIVVLVIMFQPSIAAAFADTPDAAPTTDQADYHDRFRPEAGGPPDERFRS